MEASRPLNRTDAESPDTISAIFDTGNLFRISTVILQFGLLVMLIREFEIESNAFMHLVQLAFGGFLVHHFLPLRFRLPFFACLSIAGIALVLGVANCAWILALGGTLIAIAHLPIAFRMRVALLVIAMIVLVGLRLEWVVAPWSAAVWPILGSMFMFRMIIYMYDLNKKAAPTSIWWALSYFFMLPNVCFPLFPVVDYKTFVRTYFDDQDRFRIYQVGLKWMLRGLIHLLLYRFIMQHASIAVTAIDSSTSAVQFIVSTYLLYLYISGSFAFIVGLLHMFGFNLHDTHHNYLLASGITDFWRRINIYWKEFIEKIFFRPAYYGLSRRVGPTRAMILAILYAFAFTWMLHSVQWFWIREEFPVTWQDGTFWMLLAVLVIFGGLHEAKHGRQRSLVKSKRTIRSELKLALNTIHTFAFICLLWTMWNIPSYDELTIVLTELTDVTWSAIGWILAVLAIVGIAAIAFGRSSLESVELGVSSNAKRSNPPFWGPALTVIVLAAIILAIGARPHRLSEPFLVGMVEDLKDRDALGKKDAELMQRGYYEDLTNAERYNRQLASLYAGKPIDWGVNRSQYTTDDFPFFALKPSVSVEFNGATWSTNRWGMRDREYEKLAAPGTLRIALLGASNSAGLGVNDDETYENLAEDLLNSLDTNEHIDKFEILNFSMPGYGPVRNLANLQNRVIDFQPDILIHVRAADTSWVVNDIVRGNIAGRTPYRGIEEIIERAGVEPGMPSVLVKHRLRPYADELDRWIYKQMADECRKHGIRPVNMYLPTPSASITRAGIDKQMNFARQAGFELMDLSGAFGDVDQKTLWVAKWDRHPNANGHQMLARKFHAELKNLLLKPDQPDQPDN